MTDLTTKIAALEAALASGELRIESDGDMVIYRSAGDLALALDYFRRQQAALGGIVRPASTLAVFEPR